MFSPVTKANTLNQGDLRRYAIGLLSRREYSVKTLQQKLLLKTSNSIHIEQVIAHLQELGYQSDHRYAQMFFNSRVVRRLGPLRIKRELKEKGIEKEFINKLFQETTVDWFQLAASSGHTKSKYLNLEEYIDRQKLYRHLAYRGFEQDSILCAIEVLKLSRDTI